MNISNNSTSHEVRITQHSTFKIQHSKCFIAFLCLLLSGCSLDAPEETSLHSDKGISLTTSISPFYGEEHSRSNIEGRAFLTGDRIKLKVICPFSSGKEIGETTWGHSTDSYWLLKWNGTAWTNITSDDKIDVEAKYAYMSAPNILEQFEAQQTPYVYTASTWSENIVFTAPNKRIISQYSYVFHANQQEEKNYLASDLLWAQNIMQTGSYNVHLQFKHVMAALQITIDDSNLKNKISDNAIITLEGMPDIDQQEVVVGNKYAEYNKDQYPYGMTEKEACSAEDNGKVLGIAINDDSKQKATVTSFANIEQNAIYTAHKSGKVYRLILPPCSLSKAPVVWLRDGNRRFKMVLSTQLFTEGTLYKTTMKLSNPANNE